MYTLVFLIFPVCNFDQCLAYNLYLIQIEYNTESDNDTHTVVYANKIGKIQIIECI